LYCTCQDITDEDCYVHELDLPGFNLTGTIPDSFGDLTNLTFIDLALNSINGSLPSTLSQITKLEELYLYSNYFTGPLPSSLGELSLLAIFDASGNFFTSSIPETIYDLTNLVEINLSNNHLNGTLSESVGRLKRMAIFSLQTAGLHGSLPSSIGNLTDLTGLYWNDNAFTGTIPNEISKLKNLEFVYFDHNSFFGSIPSFSLLNVQTLSLDHNLFSKSLPTSFLNAPSLREMYLTSNSLTGSFLVGPNSPLLITIEMLNNFFSSNLSSITEIPSLGGLMASNNQFSGVLPISSDLFSELSLFNYAASVNYFSGTVPLYFNSTIYIQGFLIDSNYLTGIFPSIFHDNKGIVNCNISYNLFTGTLNNHLFSNYAILLENALFNNNFFIGTLPDSFGNLFALLVLSVAENELVGTIPRNYSELIGLRQLYLQGNSFSGQLSDVMELFSSSPMVNLDLSNNQFTGSISSNFFSFNKNNSESVAVGVGGGMGLTASAVTNSFDLLETISLSLNCLTGSIPSTICDQTNLITIDFDGLSSSSNCRSYIFPKSSNTFNAVYSRNSLTGTIPSCILNSLLSLQTLHISGNGLTGSLTSEFLLASNLTDLSLSHNYLTGTIPLSFQIKNNWKNLDLSYNKLTGTLSSSFATLGKDSSLSLEINRLSGIIPSSIIDSSLNTINILQGNIFYCHASEKSNFLPENDQDYNNYICSADTSSELIFTWVIFIGMILIGLLIMIPLLYYYRNQWHVLIQKFKEIQNKIQLWEDAFLVLQPINHGNSSNNNSERQSSSTKKNPSSLYLLGCYFQDMRNIVLLLLGFIMIIQMPIWISLSYYYGNYENQYIWILSSILISGKIPAIIMIVCFLLLLLLFFYYVEDNMIKDYYHNQHVINDTTSNHPHPRHHHPLHHQGNNSGNSGPDRNRQSSLSKQNSINSSSSLSSFYYSFLIYCLVLLLDLILMISLDVTFVISVLKCSPSVIGFIEFLVAILRIWINNVLLWRAIPFISNCLLTLQLRLKKYRNLKKNEGKVKTVTEIGGEEEENIDTILIELWNKKYYPSTKDSSFLSIIMIFNNLFIPMLTVMIILPDCFYYAMFQSPTVSSSYSYKTCVAYLDTTECVADGITTIENSYIPSFNYYYLCSSNIIMYYSAVYIWSFFFIGLLIPLSKLGFKWLYDYYNDKLKELDKENPLESLYGSRVNSSQSNQTNVGETVNPLREGKDDTTNNDDGHEEAGWKTIEQEEERKKKEKEFAISRKYYEIEKERIKYQNYVILIERWLPNRFRTYSSTHNTKLNPLFPKAKFLAQMNSYLAFLLAFGAIFPPLAIITGISILNLVYFEYLTLGKLLIEIRELKGTYDWYEQELSKECQDIIQPLQYCLIWIIFLSSLLFSFIIFDTWGDETGYNDAFSGLFCMIFIPIALYGVYRFYEWILYQQPDSDLLSELLRKQQMKLLEQDESKVESNERKLQHNEDGHQRQSVQKERLSSYHNQNDEEKPPQSFLENRKSGIRSSYEFRHTGEMELSEITRPSMFSVRSSMNHNQNPTISPVDIEAYHPKEKG
jgi:hypothetical protein